MSILRIITLGFFLAFSSQLFSQELQVKNPNPNPNSGVSVLIESDLLWDNTAILDTSSGIVATELGGLHPDSTLVITADDFEVPSGATWNIDSIYAEGFSNQPTLPDSFGIIIYDNNGGVPGNVVYEKNVIPANGINFTNLELALPAAVSLGEGVYWLAVFGVYNTGNDIGVTRWNWTTGAQAIALEAHLKDDTGIFGLPAGWFALSALGVTNPSCKFAIFGTIPPPEDIHKAAYLNGGQEVPSVSTTGTGSARMTLNGVGTELSYEIHVRDLEGSVTAMHFHNAAAGANGGVVKTIVTGVSAGDTTIAGVWTSGDTEPLTSALVDELLAGNIYINVHTDAVPSGEIRGQVVDPEMPKKLLISEFVVTPTAGEFIEIHNPGPMPVDLTNYYLTDATFQGGPTFYYQIVLGDGEGGGGGFGDWHARFPEGAMIAPGEFQTVALNGDSAFAETYGVDPTYELFEDGSSHPTDVPNMREARPGLIDDGGGSLMTGGDEVVILYHWDGLSDLVGDVDYVIYDDTSPANNEQVDKTGVVIDGPDVDTDESAYLPDTDIGSQVPALGSNSAGVSSQRTDFSEGAQTASGGNGVTGADETSEDLNNTFTADLVPTPNGPPITPLPDTTMAAYLNAGQEVDDATGHDSHGTGSARFHLMNDGMDLAYEIYVRDLVGTLTAVHFHNAAAGSNGPVVRTVFSGSTTSDTTFAGTWSSGDGEPLTRALAEELLAGNIYINVHTDSVPSGEIRGQIVEPETPQKLLISEFVVTPTAGEFIEIHNPGELPIDLTNYYLTDATFQGGPTFYYQIVEGPGRGGGGGFGDWHARFPEGASIAPGEFQTVALAGDSLFADIYGEDPTYELYEDGTDNPNDVPNMREARPGLIDDGGGSLLTGGDEVIVLYYWDGLSDLVGDVDYVIYDDESPANNEQVDKTGVIIDGPDADSDSSAYLADTDIGSQQPAPGSNTAGLSSHRVDFTEGAQTASGGNGVTGADETSEDLNNTFLGGLMPTPNAPPPPPSLDFFDDFDTYTVGQRLAQQNPDDWKTWSGPTGTGEDPLISDAFAFSGSNSVFVDDGNDFYRPHGSLTSGSWGMTFMMYIPNNKSGYFNTLAVNPPNTNWGMQVYFDQGGAASVDADGESSAVFSYNYDTWVEAKVIVDLDQDSAQFFYDGSLIRAWRWTAGTFGDGSPLQLDGNNFYGISPGERPNHDGEMYVDDFDFAPASLIMVGIDDDPLTQIPTEYALEQNYPNPFNPSTTLRYSLKESSRVTLQIYNVLGQLVRTLVNENQTAGRKEVQWNALNEFGVKVSSGIYIYRLQANDFVSTKKMILLK